MESARRKTQKVENLKDMEVGYTLTQAIEEASRCLLCHDAPCSKDCPAGTDPGLFIRKLRLKNIKGAIRTIKENNILGGVCAVVCPTEQLCQKACSKTELEKPVDIGKIQRFLVEHGWHTGFNPLEKEPDKGIKVAIVGSGPAGLACGAQLALAGFDVTIFEAREKSGGVLRYGVPEFRLSGEFLDRELEDIKKLGVKIKCNHRVKKEEVDKLLQEGFRAVFIATGVWKPIKLNIPGNDLKNVVTATFFLETAREDPDKIREMVANKNIAITGGGSVAMDVATTSKALGANKVYVIYRRSEREMPASRDDIEMARENYVIIRPQSIVTELTGEKGKLTGLKGIETDWDKPGIFTADNLKSVPGTEFSLKVDAFVWAIGTEPEYEIRELSSGIKYNGKGFIEAGEDGVSTSDKRIFAGGDIVRGAGMVVKAVADGKEAAKKIRALLLKGKGAKK